MGLWTIKEYEMRYFDKYERVIATKERSAGNNTVGDM